MNANPSRRNFIAASGALVLSFWVPEAKAVKGPKARTAKPAPFAPNAYVRIGTDDTITIVVALVEMGQGTFTAVPMLIAEELEVDLARIVIEQAPPDEKVYGHPIYGAQVTGGSGSMPGAWKALRQTGATAKAMLLSAAALTWNVPERECRAVDGMIQHVPSGRSLRYGDLATQASSLPVPKDVPLKAVADFRLVGRPVHRLDTPSKANGTAVFGIDAKVQGMKFAAVANCPVIGGTFGSMDDRKARQVRGVRDVVSCDTAVAVIADHQGAARKGLAALEVRWDEGRSAGFSSKTWSGQLAQALKGKGVVATSEGDFPTALAQASQRLDAVYEVPPLAHTTMEPLNCTIEVTPGRCEIWLGTQAPARAQSMVADALALKPDQVIVHNFLLGGGFGRKLDVDYVVTAAKLVRHVHYPVKVVFSREEDIQHDAYKPYFRDEMAAGLNAAGEVVAFSHRTAGSSVIGRYAPQWTSNGLDPDAVDMAGSSYDIANKYVEYVQHEPPAGLLTGNWRGVGSTHHVFVVESFIDELAGLAKVDPLHFRERMLHKNPDALATLRLAAAKAGWGASLGRRRGRGICLSETFGAHAALVTDVTIADDGAIKVDRMVCAVRCGLPVNPDGVEAQIQGGLLDGLTAGLDGNITFERGRVVQSNFHDYRPLRIDEAPQIEVHIVPSDQPPVGVGEIGTAVVAASVINAVYAATGQRLRTFPLDAERLKAT